jgi:urea carboxylase
MFESVLIANRGEIACRIAKTLRRLGVRVIAVHSAGERHARHVLEADRAVCIGPDSLKESYLNGAAILDAARITGARAIHPGTGLLSANAAFASAVESANLAFLGPRPAELRRLGESANDLALAAGIPVASAAPVLHARHLEVQIFGDGAGGAVALGERDCSARRAQGALLAESPAPNLDAGVRRALADGAVTIASRLGYRSAGVVEFLYAADRRELAFAGFQPHLGLEHGLAEALFGVDLVEWMLELGLGRADVLRARLSSSGHAFQARLYAEDPAREFRQTTGLLTDVRFPEDARVDAWIERGTALSSSHESLLAKILVQAADRAAALGELSDALERTIIAGVETNLSYLRQLVKDPLLLAGEFTSRSLEHLIPESRTIEVLSGGPLSIVVDHPGRIGYWDVGIPPSGPMDPLAHRLANRIVGNPETSAGLELTLAGPKLRFGCDALIALAGARLASTLDGEPVVKDRPLRVRAGQVLALGPVEGPGCRAYLAIRGGFDVPRYLGSRTTFTLGGFGGHGGRALKSGDVLHVGSDQAVAPPTALPQELVPVYDNRWQIGVLYGPHGAPDFFTPEDIATLFSTEWEVHFNSNRTGVRLIGPKPVWARADGGEAGLHPSNIHDVAYAIGAIDYTGDMPILLGPDGPSLGGFVCPATVVHAELWKLGQLKAADRVRFVPITVKEAAELEHAQNRGIAELAADPPPRLAAVPVERLVRERGSAESAVLAELARAPERPEVVYRRAGDKYLLVEYGPLVLDLRLRFRVHALMTWLRDSKLPGIVDLTPGIRSLQVHYDNRALSIQRLLDALAAAERELPSTDDASVPTRIVHLPLSWDDPATRLAIAKYTQSVRPDAPWCPSNIEFIRRINGLESVDQVYDVVFQASYLVLGLGDVYLGAPVATPVDPRQRLVTTKYNPARTWTPENAVGIGGAYLCIYGMEGPGGYQFVGRTLQVYNRFRETSQFRAESPWLLRFFDQIRFHPVSAEVLLEMREAFPYGKVELQIEEGVFRLADYTRFLEENQESIGRFKARQQAAFDAERQRWIDAGQLAPNGQGAGAAARAARSLEVP